jgi:endonuclease VIII
MPEGPEMYRVARKVAETLGTEPLNEVWFAFEHLQPWSARLQGQPVVAVETMGKALLLKFADGTTIYTHNQLYGRWLFSAADRRPDTGRQLRLALGNGQSAALLYSASEIEVLESGMLGQHPFIRRAGLDILSSGANVAAVLAWIGKPEFARRRLGHLLLDQSFLAGVGNYLRSEILFVAGLDCKRRPMDLRSTELAGLAEAACAIMWRSAETGGITNDPKRVRQLKQAGWHRRDYRHYVFGREGQACFDCDGAIERHTVSGRRLYACRNCQR